MTREPLLTKHALPLHLLRAFSRVTARILVWLLLVVIATVVLWFAANRLFDEAPDPQREAFFLKSTGQIPDEQNAEVGLLGLTAPSGTDFVQYGSRVKALIDSKAPYAQIRDMLSGPNTLSLTVTSEQVTCWLDPDDPVYARYKDCLPFADAPKVLEANREILQRFKHLFRMGGYSGLGYLHATRFFILLRLSAAEIHLALRHRQYEAAYRAWRDQLSFVRRNLRGTGTWLDKAIQMVAFDMTFQLLDNLLRADPQIAQRHRDELLELLRPEGMDAFDPEGIVRSEYVLLFGAVVHSPEINVEGPGDRIDWLALHLGQRNRMLNRFYAFARDYVHMIRLPWGQVEAEASRLREKHSLASDLDNVLDPFGSMYLAVYIDGQLKAIRTVKQMHFVDGKLRLATLLVRLIDTRIEDSAIPDFLVASGPALVDPFSGHPMKWNAAERRIYFPDPEYPCAISASVYVPPRHPGAVGAPSKLPSGAC